MFRKYILTATGLTTVIGVLFGGPAETPAGRRCGCSNGGHSAWGGGAYGQSANGYRADGNDGPSRYYTGNGGVSPGYSPGRPIQAYGNSPPPARPRVGYQDGTGYDPRSGSNGPGADQGSGPVPGPRSGAFEVGGRGNGAVNSTREDGTSDSPKFRNRVFGAGTVGLNGTNGVATPDDLRSGSLTTGGANTTGPSGDDATMPSDQAARGGSSGSPRNGIGATGGAGGNAPRGPGSLGGSAAAGAGATGTGGTGGAGSTGPGPGGSGGGIGGGGTTGGTGGGTSGSGGGAGSGSGGGSK